MKDNHTPGETKLKPCPFCGSTDVTYSASSAKFMSEADKKAGWHSPEIFCEECLVMLCIGAFGYGISEPDAKQKITQVWNKRPESDLLGECLDAVEGALRISDLWKKQCAACQMSILLGDKTCADLNNPREKPAMNRETEMKKPTHKTYENDRNILYPEPYNAGLDEMEAYYQSLLGECLDALRRIATGDKGDWSCPCPAGDIAKAIYAKNARRVSDEVQRTDSNAKRKSEAS